MSRILKEEARSLGFDACGVCLPGEIATAGWFLCWLEAGKHGEMGWLARDPETRVNPAALLDGARSVVVVGMNYFQPRPPMRGVVATYALGRDYHDLIRRRLLDLGRRIEGWGGRQRAFVDTSAVMEKPLAQRAGLGWQAKNTMLVHRRHGNWLALGGLLTSLELAPDEPEQDRCGTCTRCVDCCPTQAITGPCQLDARRCIAYLTIEHKGSIPAEFRELVGDRLFGCDDCLTICPWNRWAQATREAHFAPVGRPDLREMLGWDDAAFRARYRGTPVFRLKRGRWLRNICVVLGNIGTRGDLAAVERACGDEDPLVREHAAWAADRILQRLAGGQGGLARPADGKPADKDGGVGAASTLGKRR